MNNFRLRVAVIPAAGRGTRLSTLPLSRVLPKSMLPLLNKPILAYVIENARAMGAEDIYLIVGYKKELIKKYFGSGKDYGVSISYIKQKKPLGIAHAVSLARDYVHEPFLVMLGDTLTISKSLCKLGCTFASRQAIAVEAAIVEPKQEVLRRTCCLVADGDGRVLDIQEKPASPRTNIRGCGIYLLTPEVFKYIDVTPPSPIRGEIEITDTLGLIAKEGHFYVTLIDGVDININTLDDLIHATRILLDGQCPQRHKKLRVLNMSRQL